MKCFDNTVAAFRIHFSQGFAETAAALGFLLDTDFVKDFIADAHKLNLTYVIGILFVLSYSHITRSIRMHMQESPLDRWIELRNEFEWTPGAVMVKCPNCYARRSRGCMRCSEMGMVLAISVSPAEQYL